MAKFELNYAHEITYEEKLVVEIRLQTRPDQTDYLSMLEAIDKLDEIRKKYLPAKKEEPKNAKTS